MDSLVKLRSTLRGQFTKKANALESLMTSTSVEESVVPEISAYYKFLQENRKELEDLDLQIRTTVLKEGEQSAIDKEFEEAEKYKTRWLILEAKFLQFKMKNVKLENTNDNNNKSKVRLPKLEIPKFNGELRTWLPFWGQFRKIHEDENLDTEDKFVYLLQSVNAGTEARQLVESYPLSAENYIKCIEHLKSRYAREDLQTQLYVRELLNLILQKNENLVNLYDKISAQLRSLETLGVTKKNAAFILPMVESALPEETLKAWQRMGTHDNEMEKEMNNLLTFLKTEVENEQRIKMAMSFKQTDNSSTETPGTASCLYTRVEEKQSQEKGYTCVWCDKTNHSSLECYKLSKLNLEQRKDILKKKKACSICLKRGHYFKNCKASIKCLICNKRHSTVICPQRPEQRSDQTSPASTPEASSVTTSSTTSPTHTATLLQTVVVELEYNKRKVPVRALFDSGAQRSYVKEDLMKELQVPVTKKEHLTHSLFGGVQTHTKIHNLYNIKINSMESEFSKEIMALGQDTLCKNVPRYSGNLDSSLSKVLKSHKIVLTDNNDHSEEIGLLIGADCSGMFITGQVVNLQEDGLVAIRTKLGWTLQGKQVTGHWKHFDYINTR